MHIPERHVQVRAHVVKVRRGVDAELVPSWAEHDRSLLHEALGDRDVLDEDVDGLREGCEDEQVHNNPLEHVPDQHAPDCHEQGADEAEGEEELEEGTPEHHHSPCHHLELEPLVVVAAPHFEPAGEVPGEAEADGSDYDQEADDEDVEKEDQVLVQPEDELVEAPGQVHVGIDVDVPHAELARRLEEEEGNPDDVDDHVEEDEETDRHCVDRPLLLRVDALRPDLPAPPLEGDGAGDQEEGEGQECVDQMARPPELRPLLVHQVLEDRLPSKRADLVLDYHLQRAPPVLVVVQRVLEGTGVHNLVWTNPLS
mmetsp:Transcript_14098/g.32519  ORF Transcript_14098/g.32519 Transcript_14098/m.32519 type:complete len:312 (-) Transcript_14098:1562-2497(-)